MITKDKVTNIFCVIDEFCKNFDAEMEKSPLTCIIHRRFYCESQLPVRQQSARSSSLEVGFTTSGIVIAVLSLTHRHLELS